MAADNTELADGSHSKSDKRTIPMESPVIRDAEQADFTERRRFNVDLLLDSCDNRRSLLEGATRGQNRETARGAQIPFRRDVDIDKNFFFEI